jgi:hypothetical protein
MTADRLTSKLLLAVATTLILALAGAGAVQAAAPVKLVPTGSFGREVNLTEVHAHAGTMLEDVCAVASKDECQEGAPSSIAGGFTYPEGVAGAPNGDFYIADNGNHRVQEFEADGKFLLMFGKEVNATTGGDVCTAVSGDTCKSGVEGPEPGQLDAPLNIVVDPVSHDDVYVAEFVYGNDGGSGTLAERVQKFTAEGTFVLEIGKEVNESTKGNLCTQEEIVKAGVKCVGPAQREQEQPAGHGVFHFEGSSGDLLAIGEHDRLYVGEEGRVQEFEPGGEWAAEIPTPAATPVAATAVDGSTGNLYVVYGEVGASQDVIHEFNPSGVEVKSFTVAPRIAGEGLAIEGLAANASGDLAIAEREQVGGGETRVGSLYNDTTGHLVTEFLLPAPQGVQGVGFNGSGELFAIADSAAAAGGAEVLAYHPVSVAELVAKPATCVPGALHNTSVTLNCTLNGEVNPYDVPGTETFFEWGRTHLFGTLTPKVAVATVEEPKAVSAPVEGLRPNETFYDRVAGDDENVSSPETLTSETVSFATPAVAPSVSGVPSASFVSSSSAVLSGELNPENANTEYFFEYAASGPGDETLNACALPLGVRGGGCPGVTVTPVARSAVYGQVGATLEATGLQPATAYHYRLFAESENTAKTERHQSVGPEGSFTTAPAPVPTATTGTPSGVGTTSATISGTVDPDGQPATYTFELGVYAGAQTQYGVLLSGSAGASTAPVGKSFMLTGLQPATTYAYRITIASGYGKAQGEAVTFTTEGVPSILTSTLPPVLLPLPSITFPTSVTAPPNKTTTKQKAKKKAKKKPKKVKGQRTKRVRKRTKQVR